MEKHYSWIVNHMLDLEIIDKTDGIILQMLMNNSIETVISLADATGKSKPTIYDRKRRLEDKGIIERYTAQLNYNQCGLPVSAYILIDYNPKDEGALDQKSLARKISELNYVKRVHIVTGTHSFIAEIAIDHMRSLADLIIEEMRKIPGVGNTVTNVSFGVFQDGEEVNLVE
ncbi:MAG: Lrp/AsnC family transcriptional regulator [Candidatus Kariarchaeaceae archaeon]|jgi:Lrp/AsnC family leucine-responsive transcriptional regulator